MRVLIWRKKMVWKLANWPWNTSPRSLLLLASVINFQVHNELFLAEDKSFHRKIKSTVSVMLIISTQNQMNLYIIFVFQKSFRYIQLDVHFLYAVLRKMSYLQKMKWWRRFCSLYLKNVRCHNVPLFWEYNRSDAGHLQSRYRTKILPNQNIWD